MTAGEIVIRCVGVGFTYPDGTRALGSVDLEIRDGQRVAIVGRNGSGKSTLVRLWNGLLRPTAGSVEIAGRPTSGRRTAELAAIVGLVFQDPARQIVARRVRDEVAFGPANLGVRGAGLSARVDRALELTGLAGHADAEPYELGTAGMRLVAIASVVAMETRVLVLDEPTAGQDATGMAAIRRVVAETAGAGRSVVIVSHDLRFVAESVERVVVLEAGQVALDGSPDDVFGDRGRQALGAAQLEPPLAARVGTAVGVGPTPTDAQLVAALRARAASDAPPAPTSAE